MSARLDLNSVLDEIVESTRERTAPRRGAGHAGQCFIRALLDQSDVSDELKTGCAG